MPVLHTAHFAETREKQRVYLCVWPGVIGSIGWAAGAVFGMVGEMGDNGLDSISWDLEEEEKGSVVFVWSLKREAGPSIVCLFPRLFVFTRESGGDATWFVDVDWCMSSFRSDSIGISFGG
jgi:hypothetical protein